MLAGCIFTVVGFIGFLAYTFANMNWTFTCSSGFQVGYRQCPRYRSYVGSSGSCDYHLYGIKLTDDGYCYFYDHCPGVIYDHGCYAYKVQVGNSSNCTGVGVKSTDGYCYYPDCPYYKYNSTCYRNKTYVGSSGNCTGDIASNGYCYYTCSSKTFPAGCYKYKTGPYYSTIDMSHPSLCAVIAINGNDGLNCYYNVCEYYEYSGNCYENIYYVGNSSSCIDGVKSPSGYCYTNCRYYYDYSCYSNKLYVNSTDNCTGVRSPDNYCYFD